MFSGRHELKKQSGKVFLDRNPKVFRYVLDYLRNNQEVDFIFKDDTLKNLFEGELKHWNITDVSQTKRRLHKILASHPKKVHNKTLETWSKLGSLNLDKLIED